MKVFAEFTSEEREALCSGVEVVGTFLMRGAAKALARLAWIGVVVFLAFSLLRNISGLGVDDSDFDAWHRSGMSVRTDARTGVQYLESSGGCIVLRLDASGQPVRVAR